MAELAIEPSYLSKVMAYARPMLAYYKRRKTLKFFFHGVLYLDLYQKWFTYIEREFPKAALPDSVGRLIQKPSLRYLRLWFRPQDKMHIMRSHYRLFSSLFSGAALKTLCRDKGVTLAQLTGKSGQSYAVVLQQHTTKEGEIALHFIDIERSIALATIRGTFDSEANGCLVFWIGSLQGPFPPYGRKEISAATRDLNTLRPKQAVFHALCALCSWLGCLSIYAPHRKDHVSQSWRRSLLKRHKIYAEYDKFWSEYTTEKAPWGDFYISLPLVRRKLEDVQTKRRKEWIQRYARLDKLAQDSIATLDELRNFSTKE